MYILQRWSNEQGRRDVQEVLEHHRCQGKGYEFNVGTRIREPILIIRIMSDQLYNYKHPDPRVKDYYNLRLAKVLEAGVQYSMAEIREYYYGLEQHWFQKHFDRNNLYYQSKERAKAMIYRLTQLPYERTIYTTEEGYQVVVPQKQYHNIKPI